MIKVKILKKRIVGEDKNIPLERILKIFEEDYEQGLDFYELVALRLGWKRDIDALWYLSQKGIEKIEKLETT